MALATFDPFASIEACRAALIGHLNRLRIDTGGTGLAVTAFKDAQLTAQNIVDMRPSAIEAPLTKIVINDAIRRKLVRQHAPGDTTSDDVEDTVENLTFGIRFGSSTGFGRWDERFEDAPLGRVPQVCG